MLYYWFGLDERNIRTIIIINMVEPQNCISAYYRMLFWVFFLTIFVSKLSTYSNLQKFNFTHLKISHIYIYNNKTKQKEKKSYLSSCWIHTMFLEKWNNAPNVREKKKYQCITYSQNIYICMKHLIPSHVPVM